MRSFSRSFACATLLLSATSQLARAEDVLYSRRALQKRQSGAGYNMTFYHVNDVHAHLDHFSSSGTDCTRPERGCFGGYSRIKHVVDDTRPGHPNSLFLNAGDEFQGTLFFSYYGGEKIAETLNQLGFDGMTLGNHEFDRGDDVLGEFLQNLTFPIISANIVSEHPALNKTIKPYHIYEEHELAVIGVTTETTSGISSPGEGTKFTPAIEAVQNTIDHIRSTTNITRIVALTHIGYEEDQKLAEQTTGLYFVMGGHSHTPLGDFEGAEGPYPTIKTNKDGEEVFIVTAYRWGEYLGYIDVIFDDDGKVIEYHGAPVHITNQTEVDTKLQAQIDEWREPFEAFASEVLGKTAVELDQTTCQQQECLLGDFMADAMLTYRQNLTADEVDFALINAGGIRATIDVGDITRGEVLTSFPFGNSIVELEFTGKDLWTVLEGIVSRVNQVNGRPVTSGFQVSRNIVVEYNPDAEVGSRLVALTIKDEDVPSDSEEVFKVVTLDFLAGGGDNFWEPRNDFVALDTQDEVLTNYIASFGDNEIDIELEGRILQVDGSAPDRDDNAGAVARASGVVAALAAAVAMLIL
ncbi:5'-nucleotidase domain-containing protein [Earliella scabrosa]|nr:5'-nucleotidase domain-containing protein [Earliella scabrosa]